MSTFWHYASFTSLSSLAPHAPPPINTPKSVLSLLISFHPSQTRASTTFEVNEENNDHESLSASLEGLLSYPTARRDDAVFDGYHGFEVRDPYRWLDDPDAEEAKEFVGEQVKLTETVLKTCDLREEPRDRTTKLFDHPRYDTLFKHGDKYFYFHNTGLKGQSVLFVQDSLDGEAEVLLDPNALSEDGTVSLNTPSVSEDAKYLAYGLAPAGAIEL